MIVLLIVEMAAWKEFVRKRKRFIFGQKVLAEELLHIRPNNTITIVKYDFVLSSKAGKIHFTVHHFDNYLLSYELPRARVLVHDL